jgi:protein-disulfide isomerase/uncharacterized membrane protein
MSVKRPALATLLLALVGLAIAVMIARTHAQIDAGLATGCSVNEAVDCVPVLSSAYAYLFGLPVAWWAIAAYAAMAGAALLAMTTAGATRRRHLANLLLVAAVGALLFSAYLAFIAFVVLGHVCPQCFGLYVVNLLLLASTTWLASATQGSARDQQTWRSRLRLIGGGVGAVLVVLVAGVLWKGLTSVEELTPTEVCQRDPEFCARYEKLPVVPLDLPGGHVKGRADAPVTIVEFSDFECGHCKIAYEGLKQTLPMYGKDVQVRFHHYPLDAACNSTISPGGGHRFACLAAMAAECAAEQGKFWEYHDTLFDNQPSFSRDDLLGYADDLGLDRARFTACLDSDAPRAAIRQDVASGGKLGIESTPTLYFNGRTVRGALRGDTLGYAIVIERAATPHKKS